mmetsp:Transcript_102087/g.173151  ORF Transcript_102087/g.173151 Transcript_102087/m.173151 type:complete len:494 (+) Transcript_102087:77-1558(+)
MVWIVVILSLLFAYVENANADPKPISIVSEGRSLGSFQPRYPYLVVSLALKSESTVRQLNLLIDSLLLTSADPHFDILIICDERALAKFSSRGNPLFGKLQFLGAAIWVIPSPETVDAIMLAKYSFTDWPHIQRYAKMVYMDTDVLVSKNLTEMFASTDLEGNGALYAVQEGKLNRNQYFESRFSIAGYSDEERQRMRENKIEPFNAGVLMFKVDRAMLQHVRAFKKFMVSGLGNGTKAFTDQSWINYYFNKRLLTRATLNQLVQLYPTLGVWYPSAYLLHFATCSKCMCSPEHAKIAHPLRLCRLMTYKVPGASKVPLNERIGRFKEILILRYFKSMFPMVFKERDRMLRDKLPRDLAVLQVGCTPDGLAQQLLQHHARRMHVITKGMEGCPRQAGDARALTVDTGAGVAWTDRVDEQLDLIVVPAAVGNYSLQGLARRVRPGCFLLTSEAAEAPLPSRLLKRWSIFVGVAGGYRMRRIFHGAGNSSGSPDP